ncbi:MULTISPECIES: hypothetical protein [Bacillus cereus group]|uniref:hypothetical protein n=1 Tax=Bacillus cereus group TaxID=86661 RepID=UPI0005CE9017|nr:MULTISPECIES: hypothetical protein [Bacillus cereus group]TBL18448.1 hypothetical protein EYB35_03105 [Bacillus paranthracis]
MSKKFWREKVLWKQADDITGYGSLCARINGEHYVIGKENPNNIFAGYGGRKYFIQFINGPHKGKKVVTQNLWHQGAIMDSFKESLPDNAVFLNAE